MQQDPPKITIRKATVADANDVNAVFNAAFTPLRSIYRPTGEVVARQVERAIEGIQLVAEVDRQVTATVQFDSHEKHVHLVGLAVHPDFQRMGIARRLLDWIVNYALSLGQNVIVLDTIKETGNVQLFEKLGFRIFDEGITDCFESDTYLELHEVKMERNVL